MIAAILLAAGESSRMGEPKQLLDWHGRPLIAAQIDTLLEAGCRPVAVVVGAHAQQVRPAIPSRADVQVVTNRSWREGRATSIRTGARAIPSAVDAVVVTSVDQPTSATVVEHLTRALQTSPDALIAVPRFDGRNGHPPIFQARLLPELQSVTERQQGLRQVRRRHADRTIFIDLEDPVVALNLNTPDAYRHAINLL